MLTTVCAVAPAASAGAAVAAPQIGGGSVTTYDVVDKSVTHNYVDKSHVIGGCPASNAKQTCTVSKGKSMTRTVGVALGASRSDVTASLEISNSTEVNSSTSCSIVVAAGHSAKAYAGGDRYRYHVRANTFSSATGKTTHRVNTSWSYAFNPKANLVSCWDA
ncbi:hypothetical protein D1781_10920 [Amnibacterium setariae]|uniref:Uncharacterized protein n=1 Tax=Amnibacterium setariae TaxID=2306585 RepID=A0A3A1TWT2_9MICO|nr:hypothetical protein D1781_10920 [Amnibacterium setariae]